MSWGTSRMADLRTVLANGIPTHMPIAAMAARPADGCERKGIGASIRLSDASVLLTKPVVESRNFYRAPTTTSGRVHTRMRVV